VERSCQGGNRNIRRGEGQDWRRKRKKTSLEARGKGLTKPRTGKRWPWKTSDKGKKKGTVRGEARLVWGKEHYNRRKMSCQEKRMVNTEARKRSSKPGEASSLVVVGGKKSDEGGV